MKTDRRRGHQRRGCQGVQIHHQNIEEEQEEEQQQQQEAPNILVPLLSSPMYLAGRLKCCSSLFVDTRHLMFQTA